MKQIIGQDDVCRANCARVLELLREEGEMTRRQLAEKTGLSWGGITNTVNRLMEAGYLAEKKDATARGSGRIPSVLDLCKDDNLTLGVDVNDTGLTACFVNLKNETIAEFAAEADFSGMKALIGCLIDFIDEILKKYEGKRILAIGISMQGEVDGVNGVSVCLPQCSGWKNVSLKNILEERFHVRVVIGHDPDCMLSTHLERKANENLLLLRIDKSVGMAVALRGEIIYGSGLWEVAHMTVDSTGPLCQCGKRGCLEAYIAACSRKSFSHAEEIQQLAKPLATAVDNLSRLVRPDELILCGNLMKYKGCFFDQFERELFYSDTAPTIRITTVADAKAAMKGAAVLAAKQAVRHLEI